MEELTMALKDSWNSVKSFFGSNQDDQYEFDEYDNEMYEEESQQPVVTAPVAGGNGPVASAARPKTKAGDAVMHPTVVPNNCVENSERYKNRKL